MDTYKLHIRCKLVYSDFGRKVAVVLCYLQCCIQLIFFYVGLIGTIKSIQFPSNLVGSQWSNNTSNTHTSTCLTTSILRIL